MRPPVPSSTHRAGFTLLELLVGMTIASVVLLGLSAVMLSMQRSFEAANYQMSAQNDQLRVLDYISRDARTASTLTLQNDGAKLTATLPSSDPNSLNLSLGPTLTSLLGTSGSAVSTQTVAYYVEGGELIRELNGVQTILANTVATLSFDHEGSFLTTSIVFTPQFSMSPSLAAQNATRAVSQTYLRNVPAAN